MATRKVNDESERSLRRGLILIDGGKVMHWVDFEFEFGSSGENAKKEERRCKW